MSSYGTFISPEPVIATIAAAVEKEIEESRIMPIFDEKRKFIEWPSDHRPPRSGVQSAWGLEG